MRSLLLILVFVQGLLISGLCSAEVNIYKSTDNTGINKKEQIDSIEQYLINLSTTLKTMEEKLDAHALKMKALEDSVNEKTALIKKIQEKLQDQLGEKKVADTPGAPSELEKLKADILSIKNDDIEKMRRDIQILKLR